MTRFARVDMDAVAPLLPGDKVAGRVAARGEHFHWEPALGGKVHSGDPIAVRPPNKHELGQPSFVDLKGIKIGRLTVMGIAAEVISTNGQNWVVRCVCGAYETRKAKFIKGTAAGDAQHDAEPMCDWCDKTRRLQMGRCDERKAAAAAQAIMGQNR